MVCKGHQLLWCPKCQTVWCVPVGCLGHVVYHHGCDTELQPLQGVGDHNEVLRSVVFWFKGPGRNEVRTCAEGK
jgi:hypothetical protein